MPDVSVGIDLGFEGEGGGCMIFGVCRAYRRISEGGSLLGGFRVRALALVTGPLRVSEGLEAWDLGKMPMDER